jgi:acyl transferase domain-containing protein
LGPNDLEPFWELLERGDVQVKERARSRIDMDRSFRATKYTSILEQKIFGNFLGEADSFDNEFFGIRVLARLRL